MHFPSKDAERDGQIELGVPGIWIREQPRRVPVRPALPLNYSCFLRFCRETKPPSPWHLQQLDLQARMFAAHFTSILSPSLNF